MLVLVAIIHLLPLSGVLGPEQLSVLYGVSVNDPNLEILMRHRAVLFGLLGIFMLYAAFRPAVQMPAFSAGFVSVTSFLGLAWSIGGYNDQIARVFAADMAALACLIVGFGAHLILGRHQIASLIESR